MKTLYVKRVTLKELSEKWGINPPGHLPQDLFVRSNSEGTVEWEKAPVYLPQELVGREKVVIIDDPMSHKHRWESGHDDRLKCSCGKSVLIDELIQEKESDLKRKEKEISLIYKSIRHLRRLQNINSR